jgi:hypothetical protein
MPKKDDPARTSGSAIFIKADKGKSACLEVAEEQAERKL